jgi:hypothetical protein
MRAGLSDVIILSRRKLVILSSDGRVMDGMHRIAKAAMEGAESISAKKLVIDPEPDYVGIESDELPY